MESTFKPALLLMTGRALAFGVTLFIPVVLVRIFDQAVFGTYKQVFLIYSTLYAIAQLGMAESLFYFIPSGSHRGGRYVLNAILALMAAGMVCLVLLMIAGPQISGWLSNTELSPHTPLLGIYLVLMMSSSVLEIVMISRKRYLRATCAYAFSELLRGALLIVPVLLFRELRWLLLGAVAFSVLRLGAMLFYVRAEFGREFRPDAGLLRRQLAYALPFELAVVIDIAQAHFHQYAVSFYFDAARFAIYAVGCLQIPVLEFVTGSVGNVMMVRMGEKRKDGQNEAVSAIWHETTRKLAFVVFPFVGLLLVTARELIVLLFTESYVASVPIFMIWSTMLVSTVLQTDGILRVFAETRMMLGVNALRLLLIVGLMKWSVAMYGLAGPVLVTVFAMFVGKALALVRIKRLLHTGLSQLLPWRSLAVVGFVAAGAAVLGLIVKWELEAFPLAALLTTAVAYSGSYVGLLFLPGVFEEDERVAARGWLHRLTAGASQVMEFGRSGR